jgi:hypothetical protein
VFWENCHDVPVIVVDYIRKEEAVMIKRTLSEEPFSA